MAYPFRELVDFTLGSEEIMKVGSSNMDSHLSILNLHPEEINAEELASSFVRNYETYLAPLARSQGKDTFSSIKASNLSSLAVAISDFVDSHLALQGLNVMN